jgi:hypothetical protein
MQRISAKVKIKVTKKQPIAPVKLMLQEKMDSIPDDHVIDFEDVKKAYPAISEKLKEIFSRSLDVLPLKT